MTFYVSHSRVNPAMCEAAGKLVTKWLSNLPRGNSLPVSPISSYVSSCFPVFVGIYHVSPGVSPCYLF